MEKLSVLYVEDEPEFREQMGEFLARFASTLYLASDGKEGLELFRKHRPELVISDIIMPRLDGIGMVRAIRELSPDQPILFTTARSDSEFLIETIELQVDGYIPKPVDLQLLSGKIEKISRQTAMRQDYARTKTILDEIARHQRGLIAVLDRDLQPIFVNARMSEYLGYSIDAAERDLGTSRFYRRFWRTLLPYENHRHGDAGEETPLKVLESKEFLTLSSPNIQYPQQFKIDIAHVEETGHTVLSLSEITRMVREKLYYEEMANRDILTGLYNRHYFNTAAAEKLQKLSRLQQPVTMILIDLDRFKRINDLYGHLSGDEVLLHFGRLLREEAGEHAIVARWGGEEFTILRWNEEISESYNWAEHLRQRVLETRFTDQNLQISCSMGLSTTHPGESLTLLELFIQADRALYRAKERGRNRVEFEGRDRYAITHHAE